MSTEKTTTLSIVVGVAAFLAEIIFRNTFSSSTMGIILSVILAMVILCCTYLAVDGVQSSMAVAKKKEENRKREYDEKLYRLLNKRLSEIVNLQKESMGKAIYGEADGGVGESASDQEQDFLKRQLDESIIEMFAEGQPLKQAQTGMGSRESVAANAVFSVDNRERDRLLESINENIKESAKYIVKQNRKNQEQTMEFSRESVQELLQALDSLEKELQGLGELAQDQNSSFVVQERQQINDLFAGGVPAMGSILPKENELSDLFNTENFQEDEEEKEGFDFEEKTESPVEDTLDFGFEEDDIALDLAQARDTIQGREDSTLEDILPESILKELEEVELPFEDSAEDVSGDLFEGFQQKEDSQENDFLQKLLKEAEEMIEKEALQEQEEKSLEALDIQETGDLSEDLISQYVPDNEDKKSEEVQALVEDTYPQGTEDSKEEDASEPEKPLTAVELLRIKQKAWEEEKKFTEESDVTENETIPIENVEMKENTAREENPLEEIIPEEALEEIPENMEAEKDLEESLLQELEGLLDKAENYREENNADIKGDSQQEETDGILSAEDIAALFSSGN